MKRFLLTLLLGVVCSVAAATSTAPTISASGAWIRLLPADLPAAGYVTLHNATDRSRRLVRVTTDAFAGAMLHESVREGGSQSMHAVDGVDIPAHGNAELAPGGYHLMLMHAAAPLRIGQTVVLMLHFDDGSELPVAFEVRPANAEGPAAP